MSFTVILKVAVSLKNKNETKKKTSSSSRKIPYNAQRSKNIAFTSRGTEI